jgi:hypothetical protein
MTIRISASAIKLFRSCPRKHYGLKVLQLGVEPESDATNLGKIIHGQLELWVKEGKVPTHPVAQKMLAKFRAYPYWPDPNVCAAEERFDFVRDGVEMMGYTDIRRKGENDKHHVVLDWKSTGNMAYALKAGTDDTAGLLVDHEGSPDIQSTLYAYREFAEGAERVTAAWMYGETKGNHATRLVTVDFDRAKVETEMDKACDTGRAMLQIALAKPPLEDVPYNSGFCNAYGRPCPLASVCPRQQRGLFSESTDPKDVSQNGEAMTDFLSSIRASFPGTSGAPGPAVAPTPPPPPADDDTPPPPPPEDDDAPPPPPPDAPHLAEVIANMAAREAKVDEWIAAGFVSPDQKGSLLAPRNLYTGVESGFINPPEAAGKKPYANVAEAVEGEGATPAKTKSRAAPKGKKVTPILASVAEAVVGLERAGIPVKATKETKAEDTLRAIHAILTAHFSE